MRGLYEALLVLNDNIPPNVRLIACAEIRVFALRQPAVCTGRKKIVLLDKHIWDKEPFQNKNFTCSQGLRVSCDRPLTGIKIKLIVTYQKVIPFPD